MSFSKLRSSSTMVIGTSVNDPSPFPVGYTFSPTDVELVCDYLKKKAMKESFEDPTNRFQELELYNFSPEQLREKYGEQKEREMYFFVKKILKHRSGNRIQRKASNGHWSHRSTEDILITNENKLVGHKVNLVYHIGEGRETKTDWLMREYKLPDHMMLDEWRLCKVYLNGQEEIKTRANAVVKPPTVPCEQECSMPFSAPVTAVQSTPINIPNEEFFEFIPNEEFFEGVDEYIRATFDQIFPPKFAPTATDSLLKKDKYGQLL